MENKKTDQDLKNITSMWTDISIKHGVDAQNNKVCMLIYADNQENTIPTVCRNGEELINEIKKILLLIKD